MDNKEIAAIEIGCGESSTMWKVGLSNVTKIEEFMKPIEFSDEAKGVSKELLCYRVFATTKDYVLCEIESNNNITVYY